MSILLPAADVGVEIDGDTVYLAHLPAGPIVVLEGTAAEVWHAARGADEYEAVAAVAGAHDADPADVAADVGAFIEQLIADGFLRRA